MKLRVRILRQTSRVELPGEEPTLTELKNHIRDTLLSTHGLSTDTVFTLSLNGSEHLSDADETLASCGVVSGDLICVILPENAAANTSSVSSSTPSTCHPTPSTSSSTPSSSNSTPSAGSSVKSSEGSDSTKTHRIPRQTAAGMTSQPSSGGSIQPAAPLESEDVEEVSPSALLAPSWEPMLCSESAEGQAPLSLELLYISAQPKTPSDVVMVAGHQLMIETGFTPQGTDLRSSEMPPGWRSAGGAYRLNYSHPLCDDSSVALVSVCMGDLLIVNAALKVNESFHKVPKLTLNLRSYVCSPCPGESAAAAFTHLTKLSRVFKDQLVYPLISTARDVLSLPVAFGLSVLPPELLLRVLRLLDVSSLLHVSSVCRNLSVAAADSALWRHLYRRDFRDSNPSQPQDTDWKMLYKRSFRYRSDHRRARFHRSAPPIPWNPPDIFQPIPLPLPHPLPGIIGGEYDQRPNFHHLLPRPRYDPTRPLTDPIRRPPNHLRGPRPGGGRPADVRRGFI